MNNLNKKTGKTFKIALIILFGVIFCQNLISQSITWQRLYNGPFNQQDISVDLCNATNNSFYSVGYSKKPTTQGYFIYVLKIKQTGDTLWTRIIDSVSNEAYSCAESGDGGCVIVGEGHFALKLDSSGNIAWKRFYNRSGIVCYDILKTSDGGFLACGEQFVISGSSFRYNSYVMKLDFNGNMLWDTIYFALFDKPLKSVVEINGGGYIFTGYVFDSNVDTGKCLIIRIDSAGNIQWERRTKILNRNAAGNRIERISNYFIVAGETSEISLTIGKVFLLKIDSAGNYLSTNIIKSNETVRCTDFKLLNMNRFAITSFNNLDIAKAMIIDTLGNIIIEKNFSSQYYTFLFSILPMGNGDIIWGGGARFTIEDADVWLIRSDSLLNFPLIGITPNIIEAYCKYKLFQNFPNPFNPSTSIRYEIPKNAEVTIKIYDLLGKEVFSLSEYKQAGSYEVKFDGSNLASGTYFYTIKAETSQRDVFTDTKKMLIVK